MFLRKLKTKVLEQLYWIQKEVEQLLVLSGFMKTLPASLTENIQGKPGVRVFMFGNAKSLSSLEQFGLGK